MHPPVEIGPASAADYQPIADLWVASWTAVMPAIDFKSRRDWLLAHLAKLESTGSRTLLARDADQRPIGFVTLDPATGWLDQIAVSPSSFGRGAAHDLLDAAKALAPTGLQLDVNADNPRAVRFYEREGFVTNGTGRNPTSGLPTRLMRWQRDPT